MDVPAGPQGQPPVQPRERVWFAHAIRGPACLLVVFTHLFDLFPNAQTLVAPIGNFPPLTGLPVVPWIRVLGVLARRHISTGALGVLLFFLVSGFVIPFSWSTATCGASSCAASSGSTPPCGSACSSR